jgi:hypothetical protein
MRDGGKKMNYEKLNKWSAEKCDVEITDFNPSEDEHVLFWEHNNIVTSGSWDLRDARCMEIFEEKVNMISGHTCHPDHKFFAHVHLETDNCYGKTLKEARLNCAFAIMELWRPT